MQGDTSSIVEFRGSTIDWVSTEPSSSDDEGGAERKAALVGGGKEGNPGKTDARDIPGQKESDVDVDDEWRRPSDSTLFAWGDAFWMRRPEEWDLEWSWSSGSSTPENDQDVGEPSLPLQQQAHSHAHRGAHEGGILWTKVPPLQRAGTLVPRPTLDSQAAQGEDGAPFGKHQGGHGLALWCADNGARPVLACGARHVVMAPPPWGGKGAAACGENVFGQLGTGGAGGRQRGPREVCQLSEKQVVNLAAGRNCSLACTSDGLVYSWGLGTAGQLGHGNTLSLSRPCVISGLRNTTIELVACGVSHAIAIDSDGGAWTWGGNNYGQLGHGRDSVKQQQVEGSKRILCSTPRLVASLRTDAISGVACGDFHTLAVSHAGKIFAWGTGAYGCVGLGEVSRANAGVALAGSQFRPAQVKTDGRCTSVAAGGFQSAALLDEGGLLTWGRGDSGALGHGTRDHEMTPRRVACFESDRGVWPALVACASNFSVVVAADGSVWAWGEVGVGSLHPGGGWQSRILEPRRMLEPGWAHGRITSLVCGGSNVLISAEGGVIGAMNSMGLGGEAKGGAKKHLGGGGGGVGVGAGVGGDDDRGALLEETVMEFVDRKLRQASELRDKGGMEQAKGNHEEAVRLYKAAERVVVEADKISICRPLDSSTSMRLAESLVTCLSLLSECTLAKGDFDESFHYATRALNLGVRERRERGRVLVRRAEGRMRAAASSGTAKTHVTLAIRDLVTSLQLIPGDSEALEWLHKAKAMRTALASAGRGQLAADEEGPGAAYFPMFSRFASNISLRFGQGNKASKGLLGKEGGVDPEDDGGVSEEAGLVLSADDFAPPLAD